MSLAVETTPGRIMDALVSIRPYCLEDVQPLYEAVMASRADLGLWLPWCHSGYSIKDSRTWVLSQIQAFPAAKEYAFVICDPAGHFLGGCGLNQIGPQNQMANLGYWVRSSHRRQGVATAATRLLVNWAFSSTKLIRLEVLASVGNRPSQRTAEKAGAVREGILRKRIVLDGVSHDCVVYSFVRPDDIPAISSPSERTAMNTPT